ncbi:MAG: DUF488 domain-containing protein [Acidobacteriota bacterium]|nr:DUF488 domain-containing protein [Acidobacteriota bacterium]
MTHRLFTIGHSAMQLPTLLATLEHSHVSLIVDVRSRPQSFHHPHFDRSHLERMLPEAGISYLFLGDELGGRPDDANAYASDGVVDYRARRKSYAFRAGLERVEQELAKRDLALMCAEEDPLQCHRFLMISPELVIAGLEPVHIRKGGNLDSQREAEDRLLKANGFGALAGGSLFSGDRDAALESAYDAQAKLAAFRIEPAEAGRW